MAFVINAFTCCVVGWRVSRIAYAGLVLDALEQALHDRCPVCGDGLAETVTGPKMEMTLCCGSW